MAERYEVRREEPGRWLAWLATPGGGVSVSCVARTQSEATEFARKRLRYGDGGTLTILDADGGFESQEEIAGYLATAHQTGEDCLRAATYQSRCHHDTFADLTEGDAFPRCDPGEDDPHEAEWIYAVSGPNLGQAIDGQHRNV